MVMPNRVHIHCKGKRSEPTLLNISHPRAKASKQSYDVKGYHRTTVRGFKQYITLTLTDEQ